MFGVVVARQVLAVILFIINREVVVQIDVINISIIVDVRSGYYVGIDGVAGWNL